MNFYALVFWIVLAIVLLAVYFRWRSKRKNKPGIDPSTLPMGEGRDDRPDRHPNL